jgi:hypothetical protein
MKGTAWSRSSGAGSRSGPLVLPLLLAGAAPARADEPPPAADSAAEARQQYQEGTKAFKEKRYAEAAGHFEAAAAFKANAVALYTAGLAWDLASRPERAADAYVRALDTPGLDGKHAAQARDRVAALEKTLGTVAVTAPEPNWKVQLDAFTEVIAPARLHGAPGSHVLTVRIPGRATPDRRDLVLEAGKVMNLEVKDELKPGSKTDPTGPASAEKPPPQQPPESEYAQQRLYAPPYWTGIKVFGVGLLGVGIASLGAGLLLGINANGAKDAYDAAPSREGFDHASSLELWTNVALIAGGVLAAGGLTLMVVPIGREVRVKVAGAPGGMLLRGTF